MARIVALDLGAQVLSWNLSDEAQVGIPEFWDDVPEQSTTFQSIDPYLIASGPSGLGRIKSQWLELSGTLLISIQWMIDESVVMRVSELQLDISNQEASIRYQDLFAWNDVIQMAAGNDLVKAYDGNDTVQGSAGSDKLDGGDGIDTAVFEKSRSSYKTEKLAQDGTTLWKVTDLATGDVDELRSIEKLEFAKATLPGSANPVQTEVSLDVDGTPSVAYRLYRAAFNRDPDLAGLGYWIDVLTKTYDPALAPDQNQVLLDSARDFVGSAEFKSIYGDTVSNATYVLNLYKNTLGRDPLAINPQTGKAFDAPGYEYWLSVLDQGYTSRQHMFVFFSESTENKAAVAPIIATGVEYVPFAPPGT